MTGLSRIRVQGCSLVIFYFFFSVCPTSAVHVTRHSKHIRSTNCKQQRNVLNYHIVKTKHYTDILVQCVQLF